MRKIPRGIILIAAMLSLSYCTPALAAERYSIEIVATRSHGVLYLLEALRGDPHHTEQLKVIFMAARGQNAEDSRLIGEYRDLIERRWNTVQMPGDAHRSRKLENVLEVMAVQSKRGEEFLENTRALLNTEDYKIFSEVYNHFAPIYDELIWEPCRVDLGNQLNAVSAQTVRLAFNERLSMVARFCRSTWPGNLPFLLALTPIPYREGEHFSSYGHSDNFLEVVEAHQKSEVHHALGVFFHEIVHSLWYTRSEESKKQVRDWFIASGGDYAYDELNEALATALGNGWLATEAGNKDKEKQWYNDPYIDGYARVLLPLILEYLPDNRSIDENFCRQATAVFTERFPDAPKDPHLVAREILILSNSPDVNRNTFHYSMARTGVVRSTTAAVPLTAEESRLKFTRSEPRTAVFLISPAEIDSLRAFPFSAPEMQSMKEQAAGGLPCSWSKKEGRRWIILCIGKTLEEQNKAFNSVLEQKTLPDYRENNQ